MAVAPATVTAVLVTGIVSTSEPSPAFLSSMLPVPFWTLSLKVIIRFAPSATPVASSAGTRPASVGAVKSPAVKFQAVAPLIPAKSFPAKSSNAPAATST